MRNTAKILFLFATAALLVVLVDGEEEFEYDLSHAIFITGSRAWESMGAGAGAGAGASPPSRPPTYTSPRRNGSVFLKAVEAGVGIMGVVHTLHLPSRDGSECTDYIQISQVIGDKSTERVCGDVDKRSFIDPTGYLQLIYVLEELKVEGVAGPPTTPTSFNITFTPFKECPEGAFPFGNEALRPCSTMDTFSCIPTHYFCDGIINCGFPHEYGADEKGCPESTTATDTKITTTTTPITTPTKDEVVRAVDAPHYYYYVWVTFATGALGLCLLCLLYFLHLLLPLSKGRKKKGGMKKGGMKEFDGRRVYECEASPSYEEALLGGSPPPPTYEQAKLHHPHTTSSSA